MKRNTIILILIIIAIAAFLCWKNRKKAKSASSQDEDNLSEFINPDEINPKMIERTLKGDRQVMARLGKEAVSMGISTKDRIEMEVQLIINEKLKGN